jgi:hypothetical protein
MIDNDSGDYDEKHPVNNIKCYLQDIYEYVYSGRDNSSKTPEHGYFDPSIVTPVNIISGSIQDQFVFLKPNEIHYE